MYIFRTHPENIAEVARLAKHALERPPHTALGERILISKTLDSTDGLPPIRYVMTYVRTVPDVNDESVAIWGRNWPFIVECKDCRELKSYFDIRSIQVSDWEYGPGGPIVHVHPADEYEMDRLGLLA